MNVNDSIIKSYFIYLDCAPSKYAPKNYVTIQKKIEDKSSNPSKDFVNKASDSTVLTRELQDPVAPSEVHLQRNQSDDIENVPLIKGYAQ